MPATTLTRATRARGRSWPPSVDRTPTGRPRFRSARTPGVRVGRMGRDIFVSAGGGLSRVSSAEMRFGVLGPLCVEDGNVDVTPRGEQQRKALALLVATAPASVSVDAFEEMIWGGPAPSANALQALVSKLRKVVDPVQIERDARGYTLAGDFTTDLAEFEQLVASGDLDAAAQLVRGERRADLADVAARAPERARLAERVRTIRRRRIESLVASPLGDDAAVE